MKKLFLAFTLLALPFALFAQEVKTEAVEEVDAAAKEVEEKAKTLYSLGYLIGDNITNQLMIDDEEELKYITQGFRDSLTKKESQTNVEEYKPLIIKRYQEDAKKIAKKRDDAQKKYYAQAEKEKNTKKLDNGVLVQTLAKGKSKGKTPTPASSVKVHYKGTFVDGKVFDSSYLRGEPTTFPLSGIITCWTTGIQEMKEGGKAKLVCPSATAYGAGQVGSIPPNSMLTFEVELIEVDPKEDTKI
ncbi:FKBP-type peptidyl-prolyl cis-trans isomerase [Elusimicrobium posterum]|uniref:FKBP-type peptidyl-prolyl cis-trans isomerase n=1 Tax=Elusimicrobium posterum TaxID=3116653 RepID=UPI003C730F07